VPLSADRPNAARGTNANGRLVAPGCDRPALGDSSRALGIRPPKTGRSGRKPRTSSFGSFPRLKWPNRRVGRCARSTCCGPCLGGRTDGGGRAPVSLSLMPLNDLEVPDPAQGRCDDSPSEPPCSSATSRDLRDSHAAASRELQPALRPVLLTSWPKVMLRRFN